MCSQGGVSFLKTLKSLAEQKEFMSLYLVGALSHNQVCIIQKTKHTRTRSIDSSKNRIQKWFSHKWLTSPPPIWWKLEHFSAATHQVSSRLQPRDEFRNQPHCSVTWPQHTCWKLMIADFHFAAALPGPIWACCRPVAPWWFSGYLNRTLMLLATLPPPILRRDIAAMPLRASTKAPRVLWINRETIPPRFFSAVMFLLSGKKGTHYIYCDVVIKQNAHKKS